MSTGHGFVDPARGEHYPALTAALSWVAEHGSDHPALDFGLARILDGICVLVARRAGPRPGRPGQLSPASSQ